MNSLFNFHLVCSELASMSSYKDKSKRLSILFSDPECNVDLWCKLLIPKVTLKVYNIKNKQLVKIFGKIFNRDLNKSTTECGDVVNVIVEIFKNDVKSTVTLTDVDFFLNKLADLTNESDQKLHFEEFLPKCTPQDLAILLRLILHDLKINLGPKHVLDALHKDAYKSFQACQNIEFVVSEALKNITTTEISLMTPILPMLAQPCRSIKMAFKKCPNGMLAEIKYDGERVQVHKRGEQFNYFSRSLKPVLSHKVIHFKDYISRAFPNGEDLIIDAEVLLIDSITGKPLPFGTLGVHKKAEFENATVCLIVFDCMYYNKQSLLDRPIIERREILKKNIVEIKNHIVLSEMEELYQTEQLEKLINKVLNLGLEGLVLKDINSRYEPGKRHWLKIKKDYLFNGTIADSVDLVVLGAWFGTGSKGGIMSSFLMGCLDPETGKWLTVTKVSSGHDNKTLENIQKELNVVKINKDPTKVPVWLNCTKTMIPDFVAVDPKKMPVWEITGSEFTKTKIHTADGISIRFPRVTKIRKDKDWQTANTIKDLKRLKGIKRKLE